MFSIWANPELCRLIRVNSLPHNPDFKPHLKQKPFENIEGKGENAGIQHFLLFPTIFSTFSSTNFNFSVTLILSSANAFNLGKVESF